jgi:hypothetical protein
MILFLPPAIWRQTEVTIQPRSLTARKLAAIQKCEKLAALKSQQARVGDFLNGNMCLNWHFLTPDFQLLLLQRLIDFYDSKAQLVNIDVEFLVRMSVRLLGHSTIHKCCSNVLDHKYTFRFF